MQKIYLLICVGIACFAGSVAHAQMPGNGASFEGLLEIEYVVPAVNQTQADIFIGDARTSRYTPRVRVNFAEFPLVSLTSAESTDNAANNSRTARNGTSTNVVIQRIQNRLRLPPIELVVENRVATVSGTVPTERQRNLVETMLRFEPGIDSVRNELVVVGIE